MIAEDDCQQSPKALDSTSTDSPDSSKTTNTTFESPNPSTHFSISKLTSFRNYASSRIVQRIPTLINIQKACQKQTAFQVGHICIETVNIKQFDCHASMQSCEGLSQLNWARMDETVRRYYVKKHSNTLSSMAKMNFTKFLKGEFTKARVANKVKYIFKSKQLKFFVEQRKQQLLKREVINIGD